MAIDVSEPQSPGWWLQRLSADLFARQPRLAELRARYEGDAPLPPAPEGEARRAYEAIWKKARTNFAELLVEALRERTRKTGVRTAAGGDEDGDAEAQRIDDENEGAVLQADVHEFTFSMGEGYVIVGLNDDERPVLTAEDPRQVVTVHDPRFERIVRAALKMYHDPEEERDYAYLYLPGRVFVAWVDRRKPQTVRFNPRTWAWDVTRGGADGEALVGADGQVQEVVPVVRFRNRHGVAEFEPHKDVLDRIDHGVLQRMVIAIMQAFKQRAIKNVPLVDPDTGEKIDYNELLAADPGSVWLLPGVAEMWESGQVDLSGVLNATKDDLAMLAAVTRTPLATLMPGDGSDSAEGAAYKREGLVFRAEDRMVRLGERWKDVMSLAFRFAGDEVRAERGSLEVLWASPERRSLAERADAGSKAQDIPWSNRMTDIWGYSPKQVGAMRTERAADALLTASLVLPPPAPAGAPPPEPPAPAVP